MQFNSIDKPILIKRSEPKKLSDNFSSSEFLSKNDDNEYGIIHPKLIELLQQMRDSLGFPLSINSGYRTPEHNERIGGAPASTHLFGMAADVRGESLEDIEQAAIILKAGGVKRYKTFVHVDVWLKRSW